MRSEARPPTRTEIADAFGVEIGELRRQGIGWESVGWTDGTWFVKVWRDAPPANLAVLERLDLPVPVPAPRRTLDGALTAPSSEGVVGLFPFVAGRHATVEDVSETARALRLVHEHAIDGLDLPPAQIGQPSIAVLRDRLDHPWIRDRRAEVEAHIDRLEAVTERARSVDVERVLCHTDFGGWNLLIGDDGRTTSILDWDWAVIGPREQDLWIAFEHPDPDAFLRACGATDLDLTHLEHSLLRRAVQDLTARVVEETDREGVETWGFDRWRRLDANLDQLKSFS
jgi:aminoglycoside phosphotransferase (APT) family kinase protein